MRNKKIKIHPTDNEFIKEHVTDGTYRKIVKELSGSKDPKRRGRKIELTAEKLHNFLFYVSIGLDYKEAAESAYLPENTRQKYMAGSEEFRRVASLAKNNLGIVARVALARAIEGRKPGYYAYTHPTTKQTMYMELKEVQPNVKAAMWYLDQIKYFEKLNKSQDEAPLGAPRNEEEARLLEELLNRHYDYVRQSELETQEKRN